MTDKPISPLRRRMIEDMTIRGFTSGTQRGYIRSVRDFTVFLGHSPARSDVEDLRRYQLHMRSHGATATCRSSKPRRWQKTWHSSPVPTKNLIRPFGS